METETYIMLAVRLDYVSTEQVSDLIARTAEIGRMLTSLRASALARAAAEPSSH